MKKIIVLVFFVLLMMTSQTWAAIWQFDATPTEGPRTSWSVRFDVDNPNMVVAGDIVPGSFSGVTLFSSWHYDELIGLSHGLSVGGLLLYEPCADCDINELWWEFKNTDTSNEIGANPVGWTYNAQVVPIPGAVWLLGSGLIGIVGVRKKLKN